MTSTVTRSSTFTITEARYVGAKIGADLRLLHNYYGRPGLDGIDAYVEEAALLLRDGYLNTIDFGFKVADEWKLRLRYTATLGGQLTDNRPGSFPTSAAVASTDFYSYLTYSNKFLALATSAQGAIKAALPITRVGAPEPSAGAGTSTSGHGYGWNGAGVARDVYSAY